MRKKFLYRFLLFIFLLVFFINKAFFYKTGFLENLASTITYPALIAVSKITTPFKNYFRAKQAFFLLKEDLNRTRIALEEALLENIQLKASLHHKEKTSELDDFQKRYSLNGIFAKILIKNLDESEHYYLVNRGYKDGVTKNMVFIYKFQLVGRVAEIFSHHSKVNLITDAKSKIAAYTNMTNAQGIVNGFNKTNKCQLSYVSHLSKIETNDFVLSSGQGLIFPEGFCLGKITFQETKGFVHNVELEPLVDLDKIQFGILVERSQIINF
ncbi:rod shape-determining protein MreC [Candidatus Babeliales bacterium]|nr:rod shape-determining protein MreC [Candidatus Babeliales bacterium]